MFDSIRVRLAVWNFSVTLLILVIFSAAIYLLTERNLQLEMDARLRSQMEEVLNRLTLESGRVSFDEA